MSLSQNLSKLKNDDHKDKKEKSFISTNSSNNNDIISKYSRCNSEKNNDNDNDKDKDTFCVYQTRKDSTGEKGELIRISRREISELPEFNFIKRISRIYEQEKLKNK